MYNRYINQSQNNFDELFEPVVSEQQAVSGTPNAAQHFFGTGFGEPKQPAEPEEKGIAAKLKGLLGGSIKMPEINADTILLVVLAYFLIADNDKEEKISDNLLIVAALLILGF